MKKSIQDEIDALKAETAAAYAAIAAYNRKRNFTGNKQTKLPLNWKKCVPNSCVQTVKMLNCCRNTMR